MVSKEVLKRIGVFAVAAMVAVSPVLAVNANGGIQLLAGSATSSDASDPQQPTTPTEAPVTPTEAPVTPTEKPVTPTEAPAAPAQNNSQSYTANAVTTAEGTKMVSTVPGTYYVFTVDGVVVSTPLAAVKEAFGAAAGEVVEMKCTDTKCGPLAKQSIQDGVDMLAANMIEAVEGPVVDINAFVNWKKVTSIDTPITISLGVPASFRQEGYEYAVICVQEGGIVNVLPNQSADPAVLTVETTGFGVYAMIKAPAGSFDIFR